jgi:hypothetical protein
MALRLQKRQAESTLCTIRRRFVQQPGLNATPLGRAFNMSQKRAVLALPLFLQPFSPVQPHIDPGGLLPAGRFASLETIYVNRRDGHFVEIPPITR